MAGPLSAARLQQRNTKSGEGACAYSSPGSQGEEEKRKERKLMGKPHAVTVTCSQRDR
jgi:hypothetical protein